jgi:hypothetical protein
MNSKKIISFVIHSPKKSLLVSLLFILIAIPGLFQIQANFNYRIWFQEDSAALQEFDKFEEQFGNDEVLLLAVYNKDGLFNLKTIKIIEELSESAWEVEGTVDVESLSNYHFSESKNDEILIETKFSELKTQQEVDENKKIALRNKMTKGYLINDDQNLAIVYAKQKSYFKGSPNEQKIVAQGREIINSFSKKYPGLKFILSGGVTIADAYREVGERDLKTLLGIMFLLIALLLSFFFRSVIGVVYPFLLISAVVLITMGSSGFIGFSFNNIIALIPQTLMAIAIADAVHILVNFFQFRRIGFSKKDSAQKTLEKNFWPTFFTTVSTTFGFLSFSTAVITPLIHYGILAALGTIFAWLLTVFALVPLLSLGEEEQSKAYKQDHIDLNVDPRVKRLVSHVSNYRVPITFSSIVLLLLSLFIGFQNEINSNPVNFFKSNVPAKTANDILLDSLGGLTGPQIVIDSGEEQGILDPSFLEKVSVFEKWLVEEKNISKVTSLLNIIKSMNQVFENDDEAKYLIPQDRKKIASLILLYEMSLTSGKNLNQQMTFDKRFLRLSILWSTRNTKQAGLSIDKIHHKARALGLDVSITGKVSLFESLNERVVESFFKSITLALILVSLLIVFIFKSFKIGLISIIPNILPLAAGSALMTFLNIPMSIGTCLVFSVCLGIVVDDSIHFLLSYKAQLTRGVEKIKAVENVLMTTGTSLVVTTVILFFAFGLFVFAQFVPNMHFGLISSIVFVSALISDLYILPALLLNIDLET